MDGPTGPVESRRAIVVVNTSTAPRKYLWEFLHAEVDKALLYQPFESVQTLTNDTALEIKEEELHILVEAR